MDVYRNEKRKNKARDRHQSRNHKPSEMATMSRPEGERRLAANRKYPPLRSYLTNLTIPGMSLQQQDRIRFWIQDAWWYVIHKSQVKRAIAALAVLAVAFYIGSHLIGGRTFPNVYSLGVPLGDMTVDEAETALLDAWYSQMTIQLVDLDRNWTVSPSQLGISLNARKTAENALGVGMAGLPLGYDVMPVIELDENVAQIFLLDLSNQANLAAFNAGYEWRGDQLVGMPGRDGRILDVALTMERLTQKPEDIVVRRELDLIMSSLPPDVVDPLPYVDEARQLATQPFEMVGYDPFRDEYVTWGTTPEVFTSWLEAGNGSLTLREEAFAAFLDAQNETLLTPESSERYLDPLETMQKVREAIVDQRSRVDLRIRYRPLQYEVSRGDTAYEIARQTGIPYYLLQVANEGRDLETLYVGDMINLPSRDVTLPLDPVPSKRIIIDLDTQYLTAYENDQIVFQWYISSGMEDYPTSPGIFQILDHNEVALGSSYTMCSATQCGEWQMYWFMGVYEVVPGLMNGFHGAVLLPNGAYLGGGNVGYPYTFGCIMSENSNAEALYHWAEDGTVVEIVGSDFPPLSELGRAAMAA